MKTFEVEIACDTVWAWDLYKFFFFVLKISTVSSAIIILLYHKFYGVILLYTLF